MLDDQRDDPLNNPLIGSLYKYTLDSVDLLQDTASSMLLLERFNDDQEPELQPAIFKVPPPNGVLRRPPS
jgi:hypothetical protein